MLRRQRIAAAKRERSSKDAVVGLLVAGMRTRAVAKAAQDLHERS